MGSDRPAIVSRTELEAVGDPRLRASLLRLYDSLHRRPRIKSGAGSEPQARLPYKEEDE